MCSRAFMGRGTCSVEIGHSLPLCPADGVFAARKQLCLNIRSFPLYLFHPSVADAVTAILPLIVVTSLYGTSNGGHFALAFSGPQCSQPALVDQHTETFHGHLADYQRNNKQKSKRLFWQTPRSFVRVGALPFTISFLWGKGLFAFVFGPMWSESGVLASLMSVWFYISFGQSCHTGGLRS